MCEHPCRSADESVNQCPPQQQQHQQRQRPQPTAQMPHIDTSSLPISRRPNGTLMYVFLCAVVAVVVLLTCPTSTHAAPTGSRAATTNGVIGSGGRIHRHSRRHQPISWLDDADAYTADRLEWVNTCGKSSTAKPKATAAADGDQTIKHNRLLGTLRLAVEVYNTKMGSLHIIKTDDIAEWFTQNGTYKFLHRNNLTDKRINLRKWHTDTQIYVGAFQNLTRKQRLYDMLQNDGYSQSNELAALLSLAKQLLCELHHAIERSGGRTPPMLTRQQMDQRLRFRSASAPDSVDLRFAKVRFAEYLDGLQQLLTPCAGDASNGLHQLQPKSLRSKRQQLRERKHTLAKQQHVLRCAAERMSGEKLATALRRLAELERKQKVNEERLQKVKRQQRRMLKGGQTVQRVGMAGDERRRRPKRG